jgi:hypothetical protein
MRSCTTIITNSRIEDGMIDLVYLNRLDVLCRHHDRTERMARSGQSCRCASKTDEGAAVPSSNAQRRNFLNAWVAMFFWAPAPGKK